MATDRFNRQFILLDFADLDNPQFMELVRSPEFSTYLVMRRHVWRSDKAHTMGLHTYYAQGDLACALDRDMLAEALGNISPRQVTRDIAALLKRGLLRAINTGRCNIYVLGRWGQQEGVYYEYFYMDRLCARTEDEVACLGRVDKNVQGSFRPPSVDKNVHPDETFSSTINIEANKETNREFSNNQPSPSSSSTSDLEGKPNPNSCDVLAFSGNVSSPAGEEEVLESPELETLVETCSREFDDLPHLESNLTRMFNLWARTKLDAAGIIAKTREARRVTKERVSRSAVRDRKKKMAYFFSVLEGELGLQNKAGASDKPG
jgi:hypothetical protein